MQNLSHQIRKAHLKNNLSTKYASSLHQHFKSAIIEPPTLQTPLLIQKKKKQKNILRKTRFDLGHSQSSKSKTFSGKITQSTGVNNPWGNSHRQSSTNRKKSESKLKRKKLMKKDDKPKQKKVNSCEVKTKADNLAVEIQTTKSFFPMSHEEKENQEAKKLKSYLVAENGFVAQNQDLSQESQTINNSVERAANLPFDSGFSIQIPQNFNRIYENRKSEGKKMTKEEWEMIETLKIKNEELNNYIEELQASERKLIREQQQIKRVTEHNFQAEKKKLTQQISQLKQEHLRITHQNATLQQMFNEGKQNLDKMSMQYKQLQIEGKSQQIGRKGFEIIPQRQDRVIRLQKELSEYRLNLKEAREEKEKYEISLRKCSEEKEMIKKRAEQLFVLLEQIKGEEK